MSICLIDDDMKTGYHALYKKETPCLLLGFQETEIKGYPKIYILAVNAVTGTLIKAEWDSIDLCLDDEIDHYEKCMGRERMRHMMGPKIANVLIQAGYDSMGMVYKQLFDDDEDELIKIHGIGKTSIKVIKEACYTWREQNRIKSAATLN